jgi:hypothetical protein
LRGKNKGFAFGRLRGKKRKREKEHRLRQLSAFGEVGTEAKKRRNELN